MTEEDILRQLQALAEQNKALVDKVNDLSEGNDLERDFEYEEPKKRSQMLDIDPSVIDSFGDPIQLITKSRLGDYAESFRIALNFVNREYHNMLGNRFGKHSKLIPVFNEDESKNKIDMVWFSGNDIKIVSINDKPYYKIRLLVYDILLKKMLLTRIPTTHGAARKEEIDHVGAERSGRAWADQNIKPMNPVNYNPQQPQPKTTNIGETLYGQ